MKKTVLIALAIVGLGAGVVIHKKMDDRKSKVLTTSSPSMTHQAMHSASKFPPQVPAYQSAAEARTLNPTLAPAQFVGKTREAYRVAQQIPETLAQLPCYCHCDEGFGHKSLHSCFVDDHAAHCAVCTDEALLAYQLEKQQRLTPEQVRKVIIDKYSIEQ